MSVNVSMSARLDKPIVVLGAARSGTFLLTRLIEQHPDVVVWQEPNTVWRAGNARIGHDMIPAACATPDVIAHIRARFEEYRERHGARRFCEKTPANGLRLPFVLEVLPDAKLVHVIRDGRSVAVSARKKAMGNIDKISNPKEDHPESRPRGDSSRRIRAVANAIKRRIGEGIPPRDLPYYVAKGVGSSLGMLGLKRSFVWGPEFPGMKSMLRTHSLIDVCAMQWKLTVDGVLDTVAARPGVDYLELRFEQMVSDYENVAKQVFDFVELPQPASLQPLSRRGFDQERNPFLEELSAAEQQIVYDRIGATLARLGYS
ncbi:MAG: sulfotransferase family protein [Myxococcota bacterium]